MAENAWCRACRTILRHREEAISLSRYIAVIPIKYRLREAALGGRFFSKDEQWLLVMRLYNRTQANPAFWPSELHVTAALIAVR